MKGFLCLLTLLVGFHPASVLGGDSRVYDREGKRVLTVHDHGKTSTVYDGRGEYLGRIKHGREGQDDRLYSKDGKYLGRVKVDDGEDE
jgi:hypothetical protein